MTKKLTPDYNGTTIFIVSCVTGFFLGKILKSCINDRGSDTNKLVKQKSRILCKGMCLPLTLATIVFPIMSPITLPALGFTIAECFAFTR